MSPQGLELHIQTTVDDGNTTATLDVKRAETEGGVLEKGQQTSSQNASSRPTLKDKLNKPMSFHLAFLSLLIMVFIVSFDATALAVAIPVSPTNIQG